MTTRAPAAEPAAQPEQPSRARRLRATFGPADEHPYRRLPSDWVRVVVAAVVLAASVCHVGDDTATERSVEQLIASLPSGLHRLFEAVFGIGTLWGVGLVLLIALVAKRLRLALVLVIAGAAAWFIARYLAFLTAGRGAGGSFTAVFSSDQPGSYPIVRLAVIAAVILTASPYMSRPVRRTGTVLVTLLVIGAPYVKVGGVNDVIGAFLIAWGLAALLHLAFGSPAGRPTTAQVRACLEELSFPVEQVELVPGQEPGFTRMLGESSGGERLPIKVYGRDAADTQLLAKAWRFVAYKDSGPTFTVTRFQQVEHEALWLYAARDAGAHVPTVVVAGVAGPSAAILMTRAGQTAALSADDPDIGTQLASLWNDVAKLRAAHLAHGALDLDHVAATVDGAIIKGFAGSSVAAPRALQAQDVAQLLVASASLVGPETAVELAVAGIGTDVVGAALPYLQKPALTRANRRLVRKDRHLLDHIHDEVKKQTGLEDAPAIELRRVKPLTIVMFIALGFAMWVILGEIGSISELIDTLKTADVPWAIAGFLFAQSTSIAFATVTIGSVPEHIPLLPATVLQMAISFTNMVAPSGAASTVMNIRFLQKQGVEIGAATSSGILAGLSGTMAQFGLFVISALIVGQSVDTGSIGGSGDDKGKWLLLIVFVAAIAIGVVVVVPRIRRLMREKIWPQVVGALKNIWGILTTPRQLVYVLGGSITSQLLYALCLACCLRAYGASLPYIQVVFVNTSASFIASLTPVPGGMGVQETALIAGLTSFGIPPEIATAAVITHRLFTTYLPPIWGSYATKRLIADGYL